MIAKKLHVYYVICDFGFVLIFGFMILGWSLRGRGARRSGFGCNKKNSFIKWVGSGNGYRPAGRVRAKRNRTQTQPVAIPKSRNQLLQQTIGGKAVYYEFITSSKPCKNEFCALSTTLGMDGQGLSFWLLSRKNCCYLLRTI